MRAGLNEKQTHLVMQRITLFKICFPLFLFISITAFSQTDDLNHLKYQVYKTRLKTRFMFTDSLNPYLAGAFIPASKRNTIDKKLEFGDATIYLANYIQVLATEFAWLQSQKLPTDSTLYDLYMAIETFVRLDRNAEYTFRRQGAIATDFDINGFFIRDDIDSNYIRQHQNQLAGIDSTWTVTSDFIARQRYNAGLNKGSQYALEMSKDQCWHLYLAFALVTKLLPDIQLCDDNGNCYDFAERVNNITRKIQFQLTGAGNEDHQWEIYNPVDGHKVPENRGGNVRLYSYGFGIAGSEITGHRLHAYHSRSALWRTAFLGAWKWEDWEADDFGSRALSTIGNVRSLNDFKRLVDESRQKNIYSYPQFPLIHLLLFPIEYKKNVWITADSIAATLKQKIDEAPLSGPGYGAPSFWTPCNNTVWPERCGRAFKGDQFNGLDYMLLHNLYYLIHMEAMQHKSGLVSKLPQLLIKQPMETVLSPFPLQYIKFKPVGFEGIFGKKE